VGCLAERYGDPKRSGIYRVSSRRVPILAAREAGADLQECDVTKVEAALGRTFRQPTGQPLGRPCVLLVHDATHFCKGDPPQAMQLVRRLQAAFRELSAGADPCFVVLEDPFNTLDLPSLWREPATTPRLWATSPA
jgi:hypothetical protein